MAFIMRMIENNARPINKVKLALPVIASNYPSKSNCICTSNCIHYNYYQRIGQLLSTPIIIQINNQCIKY